MSDTFTDEYADTDDEGTEATAAEPTPEVKRARPSYELQVIGDDLPEQDSGQRRGSDGNAFVRLLSPIADDPDLHNVWVQVAEYSTANGAKLALKAIESGERAVPDGDWEFDLRRVNHPETGKRISRLYARFGA